MDDNKEEATVVTYTSREAIAYEALERCFGIHEDSTEAEQAWGLKASEEDAVLAILSALFPAKWKNDADHIYRLRDDERLNELAVEWFDIAQEAADLEDILNQFLPILDAAFDNELVAEAQKLGIDVEVERHDPYFLADLLHQFRAVPEQQRAEALAAVNNGETLDRFVRHS